MAGQYDSDPFDEDEVNPFSVSVNYPCVYFFSALVPTFSSRSMPLML
jgi:hypothetical protein